MSAKRIAIALGVLAASVSVGFSLQAALRAEDATAGAHAPAPVAHKPALTRLERLPCFGCHNIEHYRKGKPKVAGAAPAAEGEPSAEFSHVFHQEQGVGHCHVCHAMQGHFEVTIRKETCAGCH